MQKSEHERGQQYHKEEAWAKLHDATLILIVQGTEEGRTKEQKLFGPVTILTGAFDTPGRLHHLYAIQSFILLNVSTLKSLTRF